MGDVDGLWWYRTIKITLQAENMQKDLNNKLIQVVIVLWLENICEDIIYSLTFIINVKENEKNI